MERDLQISPLAAPLRREIENRLRTAITEGRFKAGDRLIERELCEMLGVSRPSLREALRQLEAEELVTIVPNRGPVVATVTAEEAQEIYDVRAMLEGLAARRFAENADGADIVRLREALGELERVAEGGTCASLIAAKARFYDILLGSCGNRVIRRMLTQLHNRVSLLRATSLSQPGRINDMLAEIRLMMEAVERRDGQAAWKATINHVVHAADAAITVLRSQQRGRSREVSV
jgi:DNA-binding GntR family transcriptional regulator